jgi:reactive intermediate/imine deaminase
MDAHHQARRGLLAEPRPASTSVEIGALLSPKAHFSIEMLGICPRPGFEKTPVNSDALPQPIGGYSPAIRAGDFVFVAGQVPTDWQSSVAPEAQVNPGFWAGNKIDREARYILGHVASVLEAAGSSLQNTVKVNIHLRDMNDIPRLDHVWREYFPIDPPARTIFPVNGLGAKESRIEITVIAVTNDGSARKEVIATKSARSPLFHESQAVRAGDFLFLSGVLAADGNGLIEAARPKPNLPYERYSAGAQMADILAQAESICAAAGADLRNCLRMHNVYRDLHDYASARAVQEPYFSKGMPTVSTLQVSTDLQVPGCTVISDFWVAMKD